MYEKTWYKFPIQLQNQTVVEVRDRGRKNIGLAIWMQNFQSFDNILQLLRKKPKSENLVVMKPDEEAFKKTPRRFVA